MDSTCQAKKSIKNLFIPSHCITLATGNEETLNQLAYPILDDSVCANHWTDFLPVNELCAGYENQRKDFCGV